MIVNVIESTSIYIENALRLDKRSSAAPFFSLLLFYILLVYSLIIRLAGILN